MGIIQALVSDYERDKLRLHAEMVARFAKALDISADELLGIKASANSKNKTSLRLIKRLNKIETLPFAQQKMVLKTVDALLKAVEK